MLEEFKAISQLQPVELSAIQDEDLVLLTKSGQNPKTRTVDIDQLRGLMAVAASGAIVDEFTLKILNGFITLGKISRDKVLESREYPHRCLGELARLSRKDLNLGKVAYQNYSVMPLTEYNALKKKESSRIYFTRIDKPLFTISFDYGNDIDPVSTRTVEEGQPVGELPDAIRDGYYFVGWFTSSVGGRQVTATTVPTRSCTYYAQWMSKVIHYEKVGGIVLDKGIASGFNETSYLRTIDDINFSKPLTIVIKATTGNYDEINENQEVFGMIEPNSNLEFGVNVRKFMWEVATGSITTKSPISANKTYWWKVIKNGNLITCYYKEDGTENWKEDISDSRTTNVVGKAVIGTDIDSPPEYWRGTIDIDSSYIEMDGQKFWFKLKS